LELWNTLASFGSSAIMRHLDSNAATFHSELTNSLEIVIGICSAGLEIDNMNCPLEFLLSNAPALLELLNRYKSRDDVQHSLMRILHEFCVSNLLFLEAADCQRFFHFVGELVQRFVILHQNRLSKMGSESCEFDTFADFEVLLDVISSILSKDTFSFAETETNLAGDIALFCVSTIMQYISPSCLRLPCFSKTYFRCVEEILTTYPQKAFGSLDLNGQTRLLDVLSATACCHESDLAACALRVLSCLYGTGLWKSSSILASKSQHFCVLLVNMILLLPIDDDLVSPVADAFLAIGRVPNVDFGSIFETLKNRCSDQEALRHSILKMMECLAPFNQKPSTRSVRLSFRGEFRQVVETSRSLLGE